MSRLFVLKSIVNGWTLEERETGEPTQVTGFCYKEKWTEEEQRKEELEAVRLLLLYISNQLVTYNGFSEHNISITIEKGDEI